MIAKIKTVILIVKNAIRFYQFLTEQITNAAYQIALKHDRAAFRVINDTSLSKQERLEALREIENSFNRF